MTTLTEMIAEINGQMPGLPSAMVKDALNRSQRDVCRHWPWVWLESTWNLGTFTPISSPGYVTDVSSDRVTVTGVGTTFITSGLDDYAEFGTGTLTGVYRIRLNGQDQTYIIATVDGDTQLTLSSTTPYVGASLSASDEAEYSIYRNVYILDTTVEVIEGVRSSWGMTPIAQEDLDTIDPRRQTFGQPTRYLIGGGSTPTIELWPIPDADYLIQYWGIRRPVAMTTGVDIPLVDGDIIVKKAMVNLASKYIRLYPEEGKVVSAMLPLWKGEYDEALSDLLRSDGRVRTERPGMVDHLGKPRISSSMIEYDLEGDF